MKRIISSLITIAFLYSCGGSSASGTSGGEETTTVQQLLSAGIQAEPEDILDGEWSVYSYDASETNTVVSDDDIESEISFAIEEGISASISYAKKDRKKMNTFSAPPLFEYTENVFGPKSTIEAMGREFYMCDEAPIEK